MIAQAIARGEQIAFIGDYDVDDAASCAILIRWLRACGCTEPMFQIPQRLTEGYGPNIPAIDSLAARGAKLLIIADSASTAFDQVSHAKQIGFEVIVIDHHEPREDGTLPDGIFVNPKISGPPTHICALRGLPF